jgi:predicted metal-dependent phosphoesterase TrpH
MNCDFHCHSTVSDGLLPPDVVVRRAAANGVDRLALTDHDSTGGLDLARQTAREVGIDLVNGVEISIEWEGMPYHIVGLGIDPDESTFATGLESVRSGRVDRAQRMSAELEKVGIPGVFEGAQKYAENPLLISRAHFGRYMVEIGVASDLHKIFESFLVPGKPGYVDHRWATLEESVRWIHAAGGLAVVAHPARYKVSAATLRRMLAAFRDCGGDAIEVATGSHNPEQMAHFARVAWEYGFLGSRGSDFHGPDESWADLGKVSELPEGVTPIWTAL